MFDDLDLKSTYSSYDDDLINTFYNPVLKESIKYDRASAYFSAKALALYSKGLETFARGGNHMRLIISAQLDESDYEQMKEGYHYREIIDNRLIPKLRETLSLEEERSISNLAYLISLGIIDIKIAFTKRGIFHDKVGILKDRSGNIICFRGSNNETEAAINANYESFDITCSWQSSSFDYQKITLSIEKFERLWNNSVDNIQVKPIDKVVVSEIMTHNRNKIISDACQLDDGAAVLDLDDGILRLYINEGLDTSIVWRGSLYKLKLKKYLDLENQYDRVKCFKKTLGYIEFKKIIRIIQNDSIKQGYKVFTTNRLDCFIKAKELYIFERANLGIQIKAHSKQIAERFCEYKAVVDREMCRALREQQMWDSFFMCAMKRSANFSVPGSGKTASVYGVYAYLKSQALINKVVMIGPNNSFGSWIDEFRACFGDKQTLKAFNIHSKDYSTAIDKKRAVLFESGNKNLLLFNYEGIATYRKELKSIIDQNTLLVLDEIHKIKRYDGVMGSRAKEVYNVAANAAYIIALTGTPIPNSYVDIYNMLHILYREEYREFFGFEYKQLKKPSEYDIAQINEKLQPFYCRTTKAQLGVPDANEDISVCSYATDQENILFHILLQKYRKNKLALVVRLLQLESDPRMLLKKLAPSDFKEILDVSGEINDIEYKDYSNKVVDIIDNFGYTEKFKLCIEQAKKLIGEGKSVIIWCIFIDSIQNISRELEKIGYKTGVIYGDIDNEERAQIINDFKNRRIDVLITNPHTLAESVSLHSACHDAIYFEYSYNLVHLLQSKDRIHRLGLATDQYTQYYFMEEVYQSEIGDYSIGMQIYDRLKFKENVMLDAIENQEFESGYTDEEDLEKIFSPLGL